MGKLLTSLSVLIALFVMGCGATTYVDVRESLPPRAKVGVLLTNSGGGGASSLLGPGGFAKNMGMNFVYNALIRNGLQPISLNSIDMYPAYDFYNDTDTKLNEAANVNGEQAVAIKFAHVPVFFENIQPYLTEKGIEYILLLNVAGASNLGEHIRGILVNVSDLRVVASKYHDRASWIVFGVDPEYGFAQVDKMIKEFMRGDKKSKRRPARRRRAPEPEDDDEFEDY